VDTGQEAAGLCAGVGYGTDGDANWRTQVPDQPWTAAIEAAAADLAATLNGMSGLGGLRDGG